MAKQEPRSQAHLDQLRKYRTKAEPDYSLHFIQQQFKRDIEKPYKQLGDITQVWQALVPEALLKRTRLLSLRSGTLRVAVDSSSMQYELDRLLRAGLKQQLIQQCRGKGLRNIRLEVQPMNNPSPDDAEGR